MRIRLVAVLSLLCACHGPGGVERVAEDCAATVDDTVRTRLHVTWKAPAGGASWVEFSADGRAPIVAPATDGEAHSAVLVGAGPLEDVAWTAVTEIDGRQYSCAGEISTGNTDAGMPPIEVVNWNSVRSSPERFVLGVVMGADGALVFLIDREGRYTWWQRVEKERIAVDVEPIGGGVVTWNAFDAKFVLDLGVLRTASVTGGEIDEVATPMGHHTFEVTPDGYAWLALDVREWTDPDSGEVFQLAGDALMVGDRPIWTSWDTFEPVRVVDWERPFYANVTDWTHGNGLTWDAERGSFLYSTRALRTVLEIDAATGEVITGYGDHGEHGFGSEARFEDQHDPSYTPEGALLLTTVEPSARTMQAMEWHVVETGTIEPGWSTEAGPHVAFLGQATRLPNGNTLVGYGSAGVVQEITPDQQVVWEMRAGLGYSVGMVTLIGDPQDMRPQ